MRLPTAAHLGRYIAQLTSPGIPIYSEIDTSPAKRLVRPNSRSGRNVSSP